MSHGDRIVETPLGFEPLARSDNSPIAAIGNGSGMLGIQFHPEVVHTPNGKDLLANFVHEVCGCGRLWTPANFIADTVERIRGQVGSGKVICALSGGVDSAVAAALVNRAIGSQLTCIFVDNGLMRHGEPDEVVDTFNQHLEIDLSARRRCRELPWRARRGYGPGGEAAAHRPGLHRSIRRPGSLTGPGRLSWPRARSTPM